jgi:hypothetical protein
MRHAGSLRLDVLDALRRSLGGFLFVAHADPPLVRVLSRCNAVPAASERLEIRNGSAQHRNLFVSPPGREGPADPRIVIDDKVTAHQKWPFGRSDAVGDPLLMTHFPFFGSESASISYFGCKQACLSAL